MHSYCIVCAARPIYAKLFNATIDYDLVQDMNINTGSACLVKPIYCLHSCPVLTIDHVGMIYAMVDYWKDLRYMFEPVSEN